jgi:hypothetical protein
MRAANIARPRICSRADARGSSQVAALGCSAGGAGDEPLLPGPALTNGFSCRAQPLRDGACTATPVRELTASP